jgi:tRNA-specific adenosine deaminase 3
MNLLRTVSTPAPTPTTTTLSQEKNGQNYLLTSRTLFTTHEPCIMCSMALLHSRVKEIFYIYPMEKTGGCGGGVTVPAGKGVNHRFGIWRMKQGGFGGGQNGIRDDVDA